MFIDVYLYLIGCALNMKGTKRGRKSRCSSKNRRKIFFVRVGINGFLRNTIHYTRGSLPEERKTLARTHEGGLSRRPFKPSAYKRRIRSNYARDIKPGQDMRGTRCMRLWCERFNANILDRCSLWCKSEIFISLSVALIISTPFLFATLVR